MSIYRKQESSRLERSIVTAITSGTVTQLTTPFAAQTYQVRVVSTLPIWLTIGSTTAAQNVGTYLPASRQEYYTVTSGQILSFFSSSTSSGYCTFSEMS